MVRFSGRTPSDQRPNRLAAFRARLGPPPFDLTASNPTACGLPYPADLLAGLGEARGLRYEPMPRGPLAVREAIVREHAERGVSVSPEQVLLTASTSEAYSYLMRLLADPGDALLVPTPSYPLFDHLARLDSVELVQYRLDADDDWRPDLEALGDAPERCRALVVVHPNNPTGSYVDPRDAHRLAALCRDRGWALIADEVFLPFPLGGGPGSNHSFAATSGCLTFTLGGLSKSIGMPQLKLGWITASGPPGEVEAALDRLDYVADAYLSVGTPVALAAPELLERGRSVREAIGRRCHDNLACLVELARSVPAATVLRPAGGWSVVVRIPAVVPDEDLALRLLETAGVAVHPGYLFDLPGEGYLVLSLLPEPTIFAEGVRRLLAEVERVAGDGR